MTTSLAKALRAELGRVADPARAPAMQAYMKSAMPFLGVAAPVMRATCKRVFAGLAFADLDAFTREVTAIWRGARHREERYAAIELTGIRAARALQTPALLPTYEELIVTGAWWDYVDVLAAHRVGGILASHRAEVDPILRRWSRSTDLWKRRTSILAQLRHKEKTDLGLLYACIEPSLASKEFFLRKAIGWALRQHAYVDPGEVLRYVTEHRAELSPLSKREALKTSLKSGQIKAIP